MFTNAMPTSNLVSSSRVRLLRIAEGAVPSIPVLREALHGLAQPREDGLLVRATATELRSWLPLGADQEDPLWVIALPERVEDDLLQLAQCPPMPLNRQTVDLLHSRMFLEWASPNLTISVGDDCVVGMGVSETAFIYLLFATPTRFILARMPQDEDFVTSLQGTAICSGSNYNPYRVWSDEELEEAARIASASGIKGSYFSSEPGMIWLQSCDYKSTARWYCRLPLLDDMLAPVARS